MSNDLLCFTRSFDQPEGRALAAILCELRGVAHLLADSDDEDETADLLSDYETLFREALTNATHTVFEARDANTERLVDVAKLAREGIRTDLRLATEAAFDRLMGKLVQLGEKPATCTTAIAHALHHDVLKMRCLLEDGREIPAPSGPDPEYGEDDDDRANVLPLARTK